MKYQIIKQLKEKGYYLQEEKYSNGVKYFSIQKKIDKEREAVFGEVSCKSAKKMSKNWGFKLKNADKTTCAINFTPVAPRENCIRYWVDEPISISKLNQNKMNKKLQKKLKKDISIPIYFIEEGEDTIIDEETMREEFEYKLEEIINLNK